MTLSRAECIARVREYAKHPRETDPETLAERIDQLCQWAVLADDAHYELALRVGAIEITVNGWKQDEATAKLLLSLAEKLIRA